MGIILIFAVFVVSRLLGVREGLYANSAQKIAKAYKINNDIPTDADSEE